MSCTDNGEGPCCGEVIDPGGSADAESVVLNFTRWGFSGSPERPQTSAFTTQYGTFEEIVDVWHPSTEESAQSRLIWSIGDDYSDFPLPPEPQFTDRNTFLRLAEGSVNSPGSGRTEIFSSSGVEIVDHYYTYPGFEERQVRKITRYWTNPKPDLVGATLSILAGLAYPGRNRTIIHGMGYGQLPTRETSGGLAYATVGSDFYCGSTFPERISFISSGIPQVYPASASASYMRSSATKSRLYGNKYRTFITDSVLAVCPSGGPNDPPGRTVGVRISCQPNVLGGEIELFPSMIGDNAVVTTLRAVRIGDRPTIDVDQCA